MIFIILQSLSSKFGNFVIVIKTRLDDDEEVLFLENLLRFLLKHEKTFNKKMLTLSPKDNNIALRATKSPFNKKFKHKKYFYTTSRKFEETTNTTTSKEMEKVR